MNEGAINNNGLYWMEPNANLIPVPSNMSHEEYAQEVMNDDLERLFQKRYIRIQSIPQYLLVDFRKKPNTAQINKLWEFKDQPYAKIIISRREDDYQEFKNFVSAIEYAETGRLYESFTSWLSKRL